MGIGQFTIRQRLPVVQPKRSDTGAATLICIEVGENLLCFFRIFGQDKLQMMPEGGLDGRDVLISHTNAVG